MIKIKEFQRWKHIKSGNLYFVNALGRFKFGGEWHKSVSYYNAEGFDNTLYTRTVDDFREKFEHVYG